MAIASLKISVGSIVSLSGRPVSLLLILARTDFKELSVGQKENGK